MAHSILLVILLSCTSFQGALGVCLYNLRSFSELPLVRSPGISLNLNFDRLIVHTVIPDHHDFIEETCIFRCYLDLHPKRFPGFRRPFVIRGCCAAAGGTYVHNHEGTFSCVFNLFCCLFCFKFVECTEVDICFIDFDSCFRYIFIGIVFTCNLF